MWSHMNYVCTCVCVDVTQFPLLWAIIKITIVHKAHKNVILVINLWPRTWNIICPFVSVSKWEYPTTVLVLETFFMSTEICSLIQLEKFAKSAKRQLLIKAKASRRVILQQFNDKNKVATFTHNLSLVTRHTKFNVWPK